MSDKSKKQVSKLKHIKSGLTIYQTGRSPFWFVRIWDGVAKKYFRKSTKQTSRIDASEAALKFVDKYKSNVDPALGDLMTSLKPEA